MPITRVYNYDKLNRLKYVSTQPELFNGKISWFRNGGIDESFSYDGNGNIRSMTRRGIISPGVTGAMDNLTYSYTTGTNKLRRVTDGVAAGVFSTDIDSQVDPDNYRYDAIGNLVKDSAENIYRIAWSVYGKIDSIYKRDGTLITYSYDAVGNRISKRVKVGESETVSWYIRDGQGNVLNVYTYSVSEGLKLSEAHL